MTPSVYEAVLRGDTRARFTTAHEAGHVILHAKEITADLAHSRYDGLSRVADIPKYRNPEWQANYFAGALLMPREALKASFSEHRGDPEIVSTLFGVGFRSASIRLEQYFRLR